MKLQESRTDQDAAHIQKGWIFRTILAYLFLGGFFAIEALFRRGGEAKSPDSRPADRRSTSFIGISFGISMLLPAVLNLLRIGKFRNEERAGLLGLLTMVGGLALRIWSMQTLGRFYTRTLRVAKQQHIVQSGPYRLIRHPGYLGTNLVWVGFGLALANWIGTVLISCLMLVVYGYRIHTEETMLEETFGKEYEDYSKRTWRLIPPLY